MGPARLPVRWIPVFSVRFQDFPDNTGTVERPDRTWSRTIDNLAKSSEGITLFGSSSASEKHGNFQIIPCSVDESNQVNVAFVGAYFTASQVSKNYFFFTYSKQDIHLFKAAQVFTLNEDLYSQVRETVIKKLGDAVKTEIDDLQI